MHLTACAESPQSCRGGRLPERRVWAAATFRTGPVDKIGGADAKHTPEVVR